MNGDLISRNALIQHAYSAVVDGVEKDIIDLSDVDNAPTAVDVKGAELAYNNGYKHAKEKYKRPQGEWIKSIAGNGWCVWGVYKCNRCETEYKDLPVLNFCPNCGADMRKGGAV